jgi:fatty-acyl-CoA synthase
MLSYSAAPTDTPLLEATIGADFERASARFAERDALIEAATGRRWTYSDMNRGVDLLARGLMAFGIAAGDRVGIWSPNCAEWTLVQYATAKIGAILVNVNPAYRLHELEFVVRQCGMRMLVTAPADSRGDYVGMARAVLASCPDLTQVVVINDDGGAAGAGELDLNNDGGAPAAGETDLARVAAAAESVPEEALRDRMAGLAPDDPINLQYTSGTTGFPKGATLTHRNILNNGYSIGELLGYTPADRVVLPVPFYHCFGMVIGNLNIYSHGAAAILPGRSFAPAETLRAVQDHGGTSLYGVPTMFIAELALEDFDGYDLSTLRTGVMAGSPCPVEIMKRVISDMHMAEVAICYGMTETSPVSTMTRSEDSIERRTSTVGQTMPHLENRVVDPSTGATVERGVIGELHTRGYSVMQGYWNDPVKTAEAVDADGWMHTGDLASMDEDGYITIEGRIKDMVIRGGENIYPREIEGFLYTHPDIQDVQVIGVPDRRYGEELLACVILKPGAAELTAGDIDLFCRGRLAHYKIPKYVEIYREFPMTISGKIRKAQMREAAAERLHTGSHLD